MPPDYEFLIVPKDYLKFFYTEIMEEDVHWLVMSWEL